jgi:hypothetical protein
VLAGLAIVEGTRKRGGHAQAWRARASSAKSSGASTVWTSTSG